ncbi:putative dynein ATPase [Helianthus annuus]|nr:putative dynein ATPase [Helianthus annuus]KAJ0705949.1 putative dynein ATPase [Helianthus annuus]
MATNKKTVMHVYKLDTGNRPPEPHHNHLSTTTTTTKKIIVKSIGALLRRSKTYRENNHNHNHNINSTKEDTKEVVLETSRKSLPVIDSRRSVVPAIKDGRKSASVVEEGRKGAPGVEVGVVARRRSAENRAEMVMINVAEVADLYQVRVLVTDMPAFMQVHAFRCARRTFDSLDETSPRQIACNMKKDFDKVYGPAWHCIVGSSFGSFVTHATGCFLYFTMEKLYVLVFKTKVKKILNNSH